MAASEFIAQHGRVGRVGRIGRVAHAARAALAGLAAGAALAAMPMLGQAADDGPNGELRLLWDGRVTSAQGPQAAANALLPGIAPPVPSAAMVEADLQHTLRAQIAGQALSLEASLLARHEQRSGGDRQSSGRVNELHLSTAIGAWSLTAGKRVVGWDVGYGFRPNDVVQQETRRTLQGARPEGRPLLQVERFGSDSAISLVWVNPQRHRDSDNESRGARESAVAARWYQHQGSADWYGFARWGERSGASLGAALSWVATDSLELHASARVMQGHDGWQIDPRVGSALVTASPWSQASKGHATQWLLGAGWTGTHRQSVMLEAWHDGTALSDREWRDWRQRNQALSAASAPPAARAGNLAAQASPFDHPSLRRDNLFLRLSWQPEPWQLTFDSLVTPADRGVVTTLGLVWQGDRWRFSASARAYGGAAESLIAQLPVRRQLLVWATRSF